MSEIEKYYNGEIHVDFEEIPIELYRKTNNEFVKYVRYDDYKKLENIIKEVREKIENTIINCDGVAEDLIDDIYEILEKENK